MVFCNTDLDYPINGTPDDVEGVEYRKGPKGWMDTRVMPLWLSEKLVICELPHHRRSQLYVNNYSGYMETFKLKETTENIKTGNKYVPPNVTRFIQPLVNGKKFHMACDNFVLHNIKRAWTTHCET